MGFISHLVELVALHSRTKKLPLVPWESNTIHPTASSIPQKQDSTNNRKQYPKQDKAAATHNMKEILNFLSSLNVDTLNAWNIDKLNSSLIYASTGEFAGLIAMSCYI